MPDAWGTASWCRASSTPPAAPCGPPRTWTGWTCPSATGSPSSPDCRASWPTTYAPAGSPNGDWAAGWVRRTCSSCLWGPGSPAPWSWTAECSRRAATPGRSVIPGWPRRRTLAVPVARSAAWRRWLRPRAWPGPTQRLTGSAERIDAQLVADRARAGDARARQAFELAAVALTEALISYVTLLGPELIVIGGGLSGAADLFLPQLGDAMARTMSFQRQPRIVPATLGADAGVIGAGLVGWDRINPEADPAPDQSELARVRSRSGPAARRRGRTDGCSSPASPHCAPR